MVTVPTKLPYSMVLTQIVHYIVYPILVKKRSSDMSIAKQNGGWVCPFAWNGKEEWDPPHQRRRHDGGQAAATSCSRSSHLRTRCSRTSRSRFSSKHGRNYGGDSSSPRWHERTSWSSWFEGWSSPGTSTRPVFHRSKPARISSLPVESSPSSWCFFDYLFSSYWACMTIYCLWSVFSFGLYGLCGWFISLQLLQHYVSWHRVLCLFITFLIWWQKARVVCYFGCPIGVYVIFVWFFSI